MNSKRTRVCSKCDYGEFPLCFAAAVGDVQICMQLLDFYLKRLDRMIRLVKDYENNKEIHDQFFTQTEAAPEVVRLDVKGGQLFSCQQVTDFQREMIKEKRRAEAEKEEVALSRIQSSDNHVLNWLEHDQYS